MSGQTIGTALATRDNSPVGMVQQYKSDFALVLPSHMNPDAFVRVAIGVLRRNPRLEKAARNDPGAFMAAMLDAARLGLEPGTEQYWLIPRYDGRLKKEIVSGQKGYQGEIELIYRAGATASVICQVVREGDVFVWNPGSLDTHVPARWHGPQDRPLHIIDWDDEERDDRPLKRVYGYGLMMSGGVSEVVVLTRKQVLKAKAVNKTKDSEYSPWSNWEEAMWLKTAIHRLAKFVPTSSEYIGVKPGSQIGGAPIMVEIPSTPPMPSGDEMWNEPDDSGPVVAHWDHAEDEYDTNCPGCRAESNTEDRMAAAS
jgi:recombination protein RecT